SHLENSPWGPDFGVVALLSFCSLLLAVRDHKAGDPVVLWGEGLPVERIAEMTIVSAYELITRLTSRVEMKYIY
ncbi:alanine racemase C-terminal domain-containing protein, partial [Salmonella enterica subsp. enterica serovar Infantis]